MDNPEKPGTLGTQDTGRRQEPPPPPKKKKNTPENPEN